MKKVILSKLKLFSFVNIPILEYSFNDYYEIFSYKVRIAMMSFRFIIKKNRSLILTVFSCSVDKKTIVDLWTILKQDPLFNPDFNHLILLKKGSSFDLNYEGIKQITDLHPFSRHSKRAIVATSDAIFGLNRIYEVFQDFNGFQFRVFRQCREAINWIIYSDKHMEN